MSYYIHCDVCADCIRQDLWDSGASGWKVTNILSNKDNRRTYDQHICGECYRLMNEWINNNRSK